MSDAAEESFVTRTRQNTVSEAPRHSSSLLLLPLHYFPPPLPFLFPRSLSRSNPSVTHELMPLYGVSLNPLSPQVKIQKDTMTDRLEMVAAANTRQQNKQYTLAEHEDQCIKGIKSLVRHEA